MAFNFNWTPLTADSSFYDRAKELLTAALNKYPKPPIIVDDILVSELNLGSVPPDLEILEVGDIAEDRFRGIFKMCYSGDAYMTLKTRVQANPLNTYLSTRPSFASPEPLAAAAGLTIPLKITLSDIKLSAFIILVFSKQKGLTLVFRNDPLESLKVSSTFDSIPFVRDYLQRTIEAQLRTLLMDEAPAIIHRLSLKLWAPELRAREDKDLDHMEKTITNAFPNSSHDAADYNNLSMELSSGTFPSLETEVESLFSHKNLVRLATLSDSQRTLSLFTPTMQDVVYRAWSGSPDRPGLFSTALSRTNSAFMGSATNSDTFSEAGTSLTRPSLHRFGPSFGPSTVSSRTGKPRKRKHRVVNLRKPKIDDDGASISGDSGTLSSSTSEAGFSAPIQEEREVDLVTPPVSPHIQRNSNQSLPANAPELTPRPQKSERQLTDSFFSQDAPSFEVTHRQSILREAPKSRPDRYFQSFSFPDEPPSSATVASGRGSVSPLLAAPFPYFESHPGGILEQAWMLKMASEIARRVQEQKLAQDSKHTDAQTSRGRFWANMSEAPPAYGE